MQVTTSKRGNVLIVAIQGSLDVITSPDLEKQVVAFMDAGEKHLVMDLGKLDYVSSAGLRVFIMILKRLKELGGSIRFCGFSKQVKQIFDIAGLSLRVAIFPNVDAALENHPAAKT